mmetsp:Transcript_47966/g.102840  ORF Transcript_47966/g.102840 Transcript_47966/m.102840 type:complete len:218 (-) Transcript_47966:1007-1660(-)
MMHSSWLSVRELLTANSCGGRRPTPRTHKFSAPASSTPSSPSLSPSSAPAASSWSRLSNSSFAANGRLPRRGSKAPLPSVRETWTARPAAACWTREPVTPSTTKPPAMKGSTSVAVQVGSASTPTAPSPERRPGKCLRSCPTTSKVPACTRMRCCPGRPPPLPARSSMCARSLARTRGRPKKGRPAEKTTPAQALSWRRMFSSPNFERRCWKRQLMA